MDVLKGSEIGRRRRYEIERQQVEMLRGRGVESWRNRKTEKLKGQESRNIWKREGNSRSSLIILLSLIVMTVMSKNICAP